MKSKKQPSQPKTPERQFVPRAIKLRVGLSRTGRGVFTEEKIQKGVCIIEYKGRKATSAEKKANTGKYLFWTSDTTMINGNIPNNKARYINHSCKPNCEIDIRNKRIFVFAKRSIRIGEELTYDYGSEYFEMYFSNGRCRCSYCIKT